MKMKGVRGEETMAGVGVCEVEKFSFFFFC